MTDCKHNRVLVVAIIASQFAPPFMFSGVAVALPSMGSELRAGATSLWLVETLFLGCQLAVQLPLGRLADATDKRTLYKLGLATFGGASVLIGCLSWMPAILLLRCVQGAASATFGVTSPAILSELVPPERRGRVFGALLGVAYSGLLLGPIIAGVLTKAFGWRAVFLVGASVLLAGAIMIHMMMPSGWRRPGNVIHVPSTLLVGLSVLGLVTGSALVKDGLSGYALLAGGLIGSAIFVMLQPRLTSPLLDVRTLVQNRVLSRALLTQLLLYVNAFASILLINLFLQVSQGYSPRQAGLIMAIGAALMAAMAPIAGRLADRYNAGLIARLGAIAVLVSAVLGMQLTRESTLLLIVPVLLAHGLGYALFASPNMTIIMNSVPTELSSTASSLSAKARSLGMVVGLIVPSVLISLLIGQDPIEDHPSELVRVMTITYVILAALLALALAIAQAPRPVPSAHAPSTAESDAPPNR